MPRTNCMNCSKFSLFSRLRMYIGNGHTVFPPKENIFHFVFIMSWIFSVMNIGFALRVCNIAGLLVQSVGSDCNFFSDRNFFFQSHQLGQLVCFIIAERSYDHSFSKSIKDFRSQIDRKMWLEGMEKCWQTVEHSSRRVRETASGRPLTPRNSKRPTSQFLFVRAYKTYINIANVYIP